MGAKLRHLGAIALAFGLLASCGRDGGPVLMNLHSDSSGPDEFLVLPNRPLQAPEDMTALPEPQPGAANRVDANPRGEAVAALGGNPAALSGGGVRDQALIARTTRYGVDPGIRDQLAAADLEYRRENDGRLLERLFNVNVYYKAYRRQELDQYRELERFRAAGVRTPAVPPVESLSEE